MCHKHDPDSPGDQHIDRFRHSARDRWPWLATVCRVLCRVCASTWGHNERETGPPPGARSRSLGDKGAPRSWAGHSRGQDWGWGLGKGRPTIIQSVDMETLNSGWGGGDQGRLLGAGGRKVEEGTGAQHAQRCDSPDPGWLWKALDARLWQGLGLPPHTHAPFLRQ